MAITSFGPYGNYGLERGCVSHPCFWKFADFVAKQYLTFQRVFRCELDEVEANAVEAASVSTEMGGSEATGSPLK